MRSMKNVFDGVVFYQSSFDPKTGTLARVIEDTHAGDRYDGGLRDYIAKALGTNGYNREFGDRWRAKFSWRDEPFSPSPEMLDISITDNCAFGCPYCYQDSTPKRPHAPYDLIPRVLKSFDNVPYQIAIGGGEPCSHPRLPEILREARELGTVPNYTTAGHVFRPDVIEATNEVCGGIAITFHAFKGVDWFRDTYLKWRRALSERVQLNIHLIADKDVVENLSALLWLLPELGKLSVVLLAYYPTVGRGTLDRIMPKAIYHRQLPVAIKHALDSGVKIAFSEGLLPYFLSRPEIGVDTRFATRSEGLFSAYVDPLGQMSSSSFAPPSRPDDERDGEDRAKYPSAFDGGKVLQSEWDRMSFLHSQPFGDRCYNCAKQFQCATPDIHHYLACAYARHNGQTMPLTADAQRNAAFFAAIEAGTAAAKAREQELGRKMTQEEKEEFYKKLPSPF